MPTTGGRCTTLWNETAVATVTKNRNTIRFAPRFISTFSAVAVGRSFGIASDIIAAGMTQFTRLGKNRTKNSVKLIRPFCQTIKVVMSPKD